MSAQLNFDTTTRATITVPVSLLPHFGPVDIDAVRESWSTTEMLSHAGDAFDKISSLVADAIQDESQDEWTVGGYKVWFRNVETDAESKSDSDAAGLMESSEVVGLEGYVDEGGWTVVGKDKEMGAPFGDLEVDAVTFEMTRGDGAESEGCLAVDCVEVVGGADGEVVLRCKARCEGVERIVEK
ncbi:hypothetical protein NEMBOFW57_001179 [Staphylotrichum longicolle]|uniref:Uncharacterized protein n=1 Tax=Staphylotrichum longicolle TaxID=669026 RepID=A0AAD4I0K7_9PEZI|nr:hypothetical protein NEMBOFW57_001179 [Staphylotrichum longicolle]